MRPGTDLVVRPGTDGVANERTDHNRDRTDTEPLERLEIRLGATPPEGFVGWSLTRRKPRVRPGREDTPFPQAAERRVVTAALTGTPQEVMFSPGEQLAHTVTMVKNRVSTREIPLLYATHDSQLLPPLTGGSAIDRHRSSGTTPPGVHDRLRCRTTVDSGPTHAIWYQQLLCVSPPLFHLQKETYTPSI